MAMSLRKHLESIRSGLDQDFQLYRSRWMDIQEFVAPRRGHFLRKNRNAPASFTSIMDNTAGLALRTLQSGMMAGISSPARPWFRLTLSDPDLAESREVKPWLHGVRDRMLDVFSSSNVYNSLHILYGELGAFGTSAIMPLFDFEDVVRSYNLSLGSYKIGTNHRGVVDLIVREFPMTTKQLIGEFGMVNVSNVVRKAWDDGNYNTEFNIIHFILPNEDQSQHILSSQNKPFSSIYYEEGDMDDKYLRKDGFDTFPVMAPRWEIKSEEHYGSGPGDFALGDVKQLQIQQKRKAQGIDKMVNPPMQAPSSLQNTPINSLPGGVSFYDEATGATGIRPTYEVNPRLGELREDISETQQRISKAFYEDLFLMLANSDRREITAREIEERHEEKLLMLGPVLERLHDELLDPLIDRTFAICLDKGVFPEIPPALEGHEIKVEYISLLAQAQKAVGTSSIERAFGFTGNMVSIYPEARHKLNATEAVSSYADMLGIPPELIRSDEEVAELVAADQQQQQAAQAMEQAASGAASAKVLSETDAGDGQNALQQIVGGL